MSKSIGIGITTRNRPEVISLALDHFSHFQTKNAKYVVVEDNAFPHKSCKSIIEAHGNDLDIKFIQSRQRLGIATAKNTCLYYLEDCEDIFLFDDDAWPMKEDWANSWIDVERFNNIGHSMFIAKPPKDLDCSIGFFVAETIGDEPYLMDAWNACMGVALHFSRGCLNALGGYDSYNALSYYGYEHAQMSLRAAQAGFTKGHRYISPRNITELIYSVDITHNWFREPIPLTGQFLNGFHSSVSAYEIDLASKNAEMMNDPKVFIPIDTTLIP